MSDIYNDCEHEFVETEAWEFGQLAVYYKCKECGFEQDEKPDNWEPSLDDPDDPDPIIDRDCDYWERLH